MSNGIDELKGLVSGKGGVARNNIFRVLLPSLPGASSTEINLLCRDVQLPGRQITTREYQIGMKTRKMPYGYATEDVSMTFLLLNDYGVRKYFDAWQNLVVNQDTQEIGYKGEYGKTVRIQQLKKGFGLPVYSTPLGLPKLPTIIQNRLPKIGPFDLARGELNLDFITNDQIVYEVYLEEAFPTTLNTLALNNEMDGLMELNVQLSYSNWRPGASSTGSQTKNFVQTLVGTGLTRLFN
jgi:hypothetical protein